MLLDLASEEVMISRLAGEAVPVLSEHNRDAPSAHQVSHAVHARPLQACAALSGILYLLEDLVPFASSVRSQSFDLLGERVSAAGLLVCGYTGVKDGPLWAVAVR